MPMGSGVPFKALPIPMMFAGDVPHGVGRGQGTGTEAARQPEAPRQFVRPGLERVSTITRPIIRLRVVTTAAGTMRLSKHATCHTLRRCFATRLLEDGYGIRTLQDFLGHKDIKTAMIYTIYTPVLNQRGVGDPRARGCLVGFCPAV
jgi:hypothetical protein